jgi:hypothetical protein
MRGHEVRMLSPLVQGHRDLVLGDPYRGGYIEQMVTAGLGLRSLVAEDAEGSWGVGKALGNVTGRVLVEEQSPPGLVLAWARRCGSEQEGGGVEIR